MPRRIVTEDGTRFWITEVELPPLKADEIRVRVAFAAPKHGHVAFVAVRDGNIRVGDDVAVFGLGAIGLLTVQVAKAAGAHRVFGIDPLSARRDYALQHGADAVFDPRAGDTAVAIKHATN